MLRPSPQKLFLLGLGAAIASLLSGANAAAVMVPSTPSDQVPITSPKHASGNMACRYVAQFALDFPCARIYHGDAQRYLTAEAMASSLEDCASACFNGQCSSLTYHDGHCALYSEAALYLKDVRRDGSGPLFDMRCFKCS
ncbi:hypothetical protein AK830_g9462 [Neonectria ditissima]|uniref:Apple domain-containing protein n=1 Tax=Neonectria ditissima TaxID=78410 RepID=A0A0P7AUR2_9HYPO|nr:hypothetical protein AK830_g9462 [Neonectria ditissima]